MMKYIKENWKFFAFMILICIIGGYFTTIYTLQSFDQSMFEETIKQVGSKELFIGISVAQISLYAVIFAGIGIILSNKIGLWKKFEVNKKAIIGVIIISILGGLCLSIVDRYVFGSFINPVLHSYDNKPTIEYIISAFTYGGVFEEILMRLFLMSLFSWIIAKIFYRKEKEIPTKVFVISNIVAALLFAGVITSSIIDKGYKGKEINSVLLKASVIAVIGLAFVYGGLTYIGAHTVNLVDANISNTSLLVFIARRILGTFGVGLIGAAIGLACLTTSIGLLTAGSTFFEKVTNGKLSYKFNAIAISIMSYIIACQGVDKIVKLSVPILNVLYPVAITIIIVTMFNKILTNIIAIRLAVYTSLVFGLLFALLGSALNFLPLASVGFGWVIPTLIALVIGCFIKPKKAE